MSRFADDGYPPYLDLPAPDRVLSPLTGWTRAHWERLADHLLDAAAAYATPDFAQIRLPGRNSDSGVVSDGIEGFARTFLLAAFRIAGANGQGVGRLLDRYAAGLAAGSDNSKKRGWPDITDCSQQMVEAAAIAVALHETRAYLWDNLDSRTQDDIRAWLGGFTGKRTFQNNWILFQVVTGQFLKSVGGRYDDAEIEHGLDAIEDWYVGDGWYTDGAGQNFDYYIGWAMHLYPLLWARIAGPDGADRASVYKRRLRDFLGQYQYFFGADGAPVHQGRSLTYRYAAVAPLWLGELADSTPLTPGQTRRLASGAVRHFTERGVPDSSGLLTLGWYGTHLPSTQRYSGPGSPYWAGKAFLGLLLPADHPAWTDREQPGPNDQSDQTAAMPAPGFLLHSTAHDGIVRLLNHGSDHNPPPPAGNVPADNSNTRERDDPHYAKLAYSNRTAPGAAPRSWRANVDSHIGVIGADGTASRRRRIERICVTGTQARSRYTATVDGEAAVVETAVFVRGNLEVRAHLVRAPARTTVREGGYAVADAAPPRLAISASAVPWALATRADGLASLVIGLRGWAAAEVREEGEPNAFGQLAATPYLVSAPRDATETIYATLVVLTGDAVDPEALTASVTAATDGGRVLVTLPGEIVELTFGAS
jgi:hypothetical protein